MTIARDASDAFENFFYDYCTVQKEKGILWGPDYWEQHGVNVVNSRVVFDTPEHLTMFLMRWV